MEKQNLTLLIMAAGMGSRFGGLKQIEPFGPHGEFLIDYSIYDAIQAGFNKVVFIIKEEHFHEFKETVGKRVESHIPVEYVFQKLEMVPKEISIPETREKPWGTAHAIYCAKDQIQENFLVINADDFYGRDAFVRAVEFLRTMQSKNEMESYGLVGYYVQNTLTDHGAVKRGICVNENKFLKSMIESNVSHENGKILARPLDGRDEFEVSKDNLVAMNMFCFSPMVFSYIEEKMHEFFQENQSQLEVCEFLMPDVLTKAIQENRATVEIIPTNAKWMGVTYREDKEGVVSSLNELIKEGVYPEVLWEK